MAFKVKDKKWLGYFFYVVLVTIVLLYVLFPAEKVEKFIDSSVSRIEPGLSFGAARIRPWLPAGLHFVESRIYARDKSQSAIFRAESFYIGPQIVQLLKGESRLQIDGQAYNGEIDGWIDLPDENKGSLAGEIIFQNFDLAAHEILTKELKHKVIGSVGGNITFAGNSANIDDINGKAALRLTDGQLLFQEAIFGIPSIDMRGVELEMELNNRKVNIVKAELAGSDIKGSVTGSIQLHKDIMRSSLNLKGTLEPLAEFYKNNPNIRELLKNMKKRVKRGQYFFAVTGTLDEPRFKLL
jgi:type II secretion system protein N